MSRFVAHLRLSSEPNREWITVVEAISMGDAYSAAGDRIRAFRSVGFLSGAIDTVHVYPQGRRERSHVEYC